ncbi:MAG: Omp28-related outer membrane protein, partial [Bacteroidaceae bacterium]|nr:Omp28-related outer membrane protein [Bacteroidaceae bacterium]
VWENNSVYNALTPSIVEKMRSEGTTVFHERLTPGATEDGLDGEWSEYSVDLRQFAGKNIYIAFINENEAQSALMINNVEVTHNIPFLVTLDNASSVVNKDNLIIKGRITIDTEAETYSSAELVLKNAAGIVVSRLSAENLNLKKGDVYPFEFTEALPLEKGKNNAYSIDVRLDNTENTINAAVKNLQFQPVKRVVLEEMTGQGCVNCPLGKLAIEKISSTFGNQFIPIALHTYTGDNLGAGLEAYNSFLGLNAAPSGIINRSGFISAPMMSIDGDYVFNGVNGEKLWLDLVQEELAVPADAEISATASFNTDSTAIVIPCSVTFALEAEKQNLNLFAVILEDNIKGYQRNTFGGIADADLGAWGEGGSLSAGTTYPFYHNHVARATIGQTFNGTGGYIPSNVIAGKEYYAGITASLPASVNDLSRLHIVVMMIDANTGRVINATQCAVQAYDPVGIHHTTAAAPTVRVSAGDITVQTSEQAQVQIYTGGGTLLAGTSGKGTFTLSASGYKGMVVAKVSTPSGCITKKLLLN